MPSVTQQACTGPSPPRPRSAERHVDPLLAQNQIEIAVDEDPRGRKSAVGERREDRLAALNQNLTFRRIAADENARFVFSAKSPYPPSVAVRRGVGNFFAARRRRASASLQRPLCLTPLNDQIGSGIVRRISFPAGPIGRLTDEEPQPQPRAPFQRGPPKGISQR